MDEKIRNIKELEKTKKAYLRLRNSVLTILLILFIIFIIWLIQFLYKFCLVSEIIKNNVYVDFGDNYKITFSSSGVEASRIIYCYNGIIKNSVNIDSPSFRKAELYFINKDGYCYMFEEVNWNGEEKKSYHKTKLPDDYSSNRITLFNEFPENKEVKFLDIIKFLFSYKVKIGKIEDNNKKYIELQIGETRKYYINTETNYIERQVIRDAQSTEIIVEKGVVTEEIKLPDLREYEEIID